MGGQAMMNPRAGAGSGFGNGNVRPKSPYDLGGELPGYNGSRGLEGGQNIANDPGFALQPGQTPGGDGSQPGGSSGFGGGANPVGGNGMSAPGGAFGMTLGQQPFSPGTIQGDPGQGVSQNPFGRVGRGLLGGGSIFTNPYLRNR